MEIIVSSKTIVISISGYSFILHLHIISRILVISDSIYSATLDKIREGLSDDKTKYQWQQERIVYSNECHTM